MRFLFSDIFSYCTFIHTYSTYIVSFCPKFSITILIFKNQSNLTKNRNGYRSFSNFKAKILLVFSLFTPSVTNKKPRYSKEERQAILTKKKEIRLKRKNRKYSLSDVN